MGKKGISLVALVITIIVLVVLTGAVVITGLNVPQQGQLAVFKNNIGSIQDAVTLKMLNNMVDYIQENNENVKWIGVASGYTEESIGNPPAFETKINGVNVVPLDASLKEAVSIKDEDFNAFGVSEEGVVYHTGFLYEGTTYYNLNTTTPPVRNVTVTGDVTKIQYTVGDDLDLSGITVTATYGDGTTQDVTNLCVFTPTLSQVTATPGNKQIIVSYGGTISDRKMEIKVWPEWITASTSLDSTKSYIEEDIVEGNIIKRTYYAPIPKGFEVVENTTISTGLIIKDKTINATTGKANEFVWVPVDDYYTIDTKAALTYWKDSVNGVGTEGKSGNEPYPRADNTWTKDEWDLMIASVIRYGGFYIGRYETGVINGEYNSTEKKWSTTSQPVIQQGQNVWNYIKFNNVDTLETEPEEGTATYIARDMYNTSNYGATSTLTYSIQWDSIMGWTKASDKIRARNSYTVKPSLTGDVYNDETTYDVEKNIYDLKGNVLEWTMKAVNTGNRVSRGGYMYAAIAADSTNYTPQTNISDARGFRVALYIK